jgi:catechol 2,3-dioxygenase-like lactoylglutathione lyase family enzyme
MKSAESGLRVLALGLLAIPALSAGVGVAQAETVSPVFSMDSMNVFRRYSAEEPGQLFDFYADVLGHERLTAYDVGGGIGVMRIRAGATELKFSAENDEQYQPGGIDNATGLRLWTFFYADRDAVEKRFADNGLPAPEFVAIGGGRQSAVVEDPEGELVQLIITGDAAGTTYDEVEIGLTVSDIEASRAFYRDFVGLEELEPVHDPVFDTMKYPYRHGATTISLRHFGDDLPADTGTGGIQYVVYDVDHVDRLARERDLEVKQPLSTLRGFGLRTIWLGDPDGITNYFAQVGQPPAAQ